MKQWAKYKLIVELVIIILLLLLISVVNDIIFTILFFPFIICMSGDIVKNIFILKGENVNYMIFKKIYFIGIFAFLFSFLIVFIMAAISNKNYSLLIGFIPFWLFVVILLKNKFLGKDNKLLIFLFLIVIILIGLTMLYSGISDLIKNNNYVETIGYFVDYEIYKSDESATTYKLIYSYNVKDKEYTVSTDYGTDVVPKEGSIRTIKYNPDDPSKAIILGSNSAIALLLSGFITIIIPLIIVISMSPKIKEKFINLNIDIATLLIGFAFLITGLTILYMVTGTFSIIEIYKLSNFDDLMLYLILLSFIIFGILVIIKSFKKNDE